MSSLIHSKKSQCTSSILMKFNTPEMFDSLHFRVKITLLKVWNMQIYHILTNVLSGYSAYFTLSKGLF